MNTRLKKFSLGNVIIVVIFVTFLWAILPGIGPNLANLELPEFFGKTDPCAAIENQNKDDLVDNNNVDLQVRHRFCSLQLRTKDPEQKYERKAFGSPWYDEDRNGCDTRNDILRRDLKNIVIKPGTGGCKVLSGNFTDPYTGKNLQLQAGKNSSAIQIDHVVALGDAWRSGAWKWNKKQRRAYANDPLVLLAVDGKANQRKGAASADKWLPDKSYWCTYAKRQINIKYAWDLSITPAERKKLGQILNQCTD